MRILVLTVMAAVIVQGAFVLVSLPGSPPDTGELKRQYADQVMTKSYGGDWQNLLCDCGKTNRIQLKIMVDQYESAIGYHKPAHKASVITN